MEDIGIATSALASTSLQDALPAPTRTADGREVIVTDNFEDMRTSWIDVLPQLSAAAEEMALGDLLEAKCFNMQDAMSAIEMMDPQMDAGMRLSDPAARAEESKPLPTLPADVPAGLAIGLLDEIMCAEHGWYSGLTLTQSVYAIEFMMSAPDVENMPLRAAFLATARAVAATRAIVLRGDIHEEEDFSGSLSGLILHDGVTDQMLADLLKETELACAAALRDAQAAHPEGAAAVREASAILCRTRYRRGFCGALLNLARPSPEAMRVAHQMLTLAEAQLDEIRATADLATPRAELADYLGGRAVRKRLGSAPTKRPELLSTAEGVEASRKLVRELQAICRVPECCDDYDGLVRWLEDQTCGHPSPCVLTRSATQLLVVSEDRGGAGLRAPVQGLLAGAVAAYSGLSGELMIELLSLPPVDEYMQQCAQGELSRLRLLTVNRARQRRRLRHYLQDWAPLQEMAETLDQQLQEAGYLERGVGPFGAWALHRTLRDMRLFLRLGFELELFAPCELLFAFWYEDVLCGMQLSLHREVETKAHELYQAELDRIDAEKQAAAAGGGGGGGGGGSAKRRGKEKRGKKKDEAAAAAVPPPPQVGSAGTHLELLFTRLHLDLCRGCYLLLAALDKGGFLPAYPAVAAEVMPIATRFEQRFKTFAGLRRPPALTPQHYERERARLANAEAADLLASAASHFKSIKARLDPALKAEPRLEAGGFTPALRAEAMALIKVAVANGVLIASMKLKPPPEGTVARFSFASHPHFVVVTLPPPATKPAAPAPAPAASTPDAAAK